MAWRKLGGSRGWHETPCLRHIAIILAFFGSKQGFSLGFLKIPCLMCHVPARFREFWNEIEHFYVKSSAFIDIIPNTWNPLWDGHYRSGSSNPKIKVFLNNTEARKVFQNGIRATHSSRPNMAYLLVRDVIRKSVFNRWYWSKNGENRREVRVLKAMFLEMADVCAAG